MAARMMFYEKQTYSTCVSSLFQYFCMFNINKVHFYNSDLPLNFSWLKLSSSK